MTDVAVISRATVRAALAVAAGATLLLLRPSAGDADPSRLAQSQAPAPSPLAPAADESDLDAQEPAVETIPPPDAPGAADPAAPSTGAPAPEGEGPPVEDPLPDATEPATEAQPGPPLPDVPPTVVTPSPGATDPVAEPALGVAILRDTATLPAPVRAKRDALLAVARSGDIEALRTLFAAEPAPPLVGRGEPGDPIGYLKALSADAEAREILAILWEVLEAGFVRLGEGTPDDRYVWPYFTAIPAGDLAPAQIVELFRLVSVGDYQDMMTFGAYIFFRVEIGVDGRLRAFAAGESAAR